MQTSHLDTAAVDGRCGAGKYTVPFIMFRCHLASTIGKISANHEIIIVRCIGNDDLLSQCGTTTFLCMQIFILKSIGGLIGKAVTASFSLDFGTKNLFLKTDSENFLVPH